jgi:hypothetical protein
LGRVDTENYVRGRGRIGVEPSRSRDVVMKRNFSITDRKEALDVIGNAPNGRYFDWRGRCIHDDGKATWRAGGGLVLLVMLMILMMLRIHVRHVIVASCSWELFDTVTTCACVIILNCTI